MPILMPVNDPGPVTAAKKSHSAGVSFTASSAESLGLCDYFYAGGICLIEWAQNISSVLPEKVRRVTIEKTADGRKIVYE